ncbi:MAG: glycosyltransferase family 39 protein [Acidobacteriota bacterium]|nr:glycosyltransferase family 39 protein [Acidobacteriota bacterium]
MPLKGENAGVLARMWKNYPVFWMVAAAFTVRMIVVALGFRDLTDPSEGHQMFGQEVGWLARSLALHHGFSSPFFPVTGPTALLPPLYPFLLSLIFRLFGLYSATSAFVILTVNSVFSAITCVPIYFAARNLLDERVARLAGWIWVFYPFAIYFSAGRVWEYSLTSLLFTTCFWIAQRLDRSSSFAAWFGFGALYGLAALSGPSVLSLFPFLLLIALWKLYRVGGRWGRNGVLAVLGILAVMTPWTVRNYRAMHVLCPVRDDFWDELWAGNNGDTSNPTLAWTHPASSAAEMQMYITLGEVPYLAEKQTLVKTYIAHHPAAFVGLSLRRVVCYWTGFWSVDAAYRRAEPTQFPNVFFCTTLSLLMLLGVIRQRHANPDGVLPYLVLIVIFPLAYYVTHPLMDYRQPIEPGIVVLVAAGILSLGKNKVSDATPGSRISTEERDFATR